MNGNASIAQYGPTPPPSCVACVPPALPMTGHDVAPELMAGGFLLATGVVVAVIVGRWR